MHPALLLIVVLSLQGPPAGAPAGQPESPPAPLIVPGRPSPVDTTRRDPRVLAREAYQRGRELERLNAAAAAIISYRLAVGRDPEFPDASYRMGLLYLKLDQLPAAARAFAVELKHHPENFDAARELGLTFSRMGQHRRAIEQLEALAKRRPQDGQSWRALGFAYLLAGQANAAETALRRAIALPPPSALEHRDLGYVLAQTGRLEEARAEYRRAIAMDPKETGAWVNLANLARKEGKLEEALSDFREAERRDSTLEVAVSGEALTLQQLGRDAEAAATYRRLLDLDPGDHATRLDAIRLYDALGRRDIALEIARDGVRSDPDAGPARLILGMELQAQGHAREAAVELRRAEALLPDAEGRARAGTLIAAIRSAASDSLRAALAADSVAFDKEREGFASAPRGVKAPVDWADTLRAPARPDSR